MYQPKRYNLNCKQSYLLLADLHTHSTASIHAYSTVDDILDKTDICYVAITDHAQKFEDPWLVNNISQYINSMRSVYHDSNKLIVGAELDIDIPIEATGVDLGRLDISILSYHRNSGNLSLEKYVKFIEQYHPTVLGHPYRYCKDDTERKVWDAIVDYAISQGMVIELNEQSINEVNIKHLQGLNPKLSLGSDAHRYADIGKLPKTEICVAEYFDIHNVVNYDYDWLQSARSGEFRKIKSFNHRCWADKEK